MMHTLNDQFRGNKFGVSKYGQNNNDMQKSNM